MHDEVGKDEFLLDGNELDEEVEGETAEDEDEEEEPEIPEEEKD